MHWLGYNDAVNEAKTYLQPILKFPVALGVGLQKFQMIKVMAVDLRKCCSKDDLPTAPQQFLLSFFLFPYSLARYESHLRK